MSFAQLDDTRLFFTDQGEGDPAVVFIHGWTCDSHDWSWQLAAFESSHRVIALDLRGHGRSSTPRSGWGVARLALDVATLLDRIGCDGGVMVGHSLGAMVASTLAIEHPTKVVGIVAVDPAYGLDGPMAETIRGLSAMMHGPEAATVAAAALAYSDRPTTPAALRTLHQRRTLGTEPRVVGEVFAAMYEAPEQFGLLPATDRYLDARRCPVLAIHIDSDHGKWEDGIARHPSSKTVIWDTAGHWLHQERPDEFNELVLDWIAHLPPSAADGQNSWSGLTAAVSPYAGRGRSQLRPTTGVLMTDPQSGDPDDLIGVAEASALLEVPVPQVHATAEQGLLTPSGSSPSEPQFVRGEVIAARELGG